MRTRLLILAIGTFAMGLDTFVIAPVVGLIARDLHAGRAMAGQLITIFAIAYAVGGPMLAAATGRWAPRRVLLCGLAVFGAGNALTALAPSIEIALASRVVAAVGAAMYTANALALARELVPAGQQARALATVVGGLTASIVVGLPAGSWLGATLGWHLTIWLVVALTAVAIAGVVTVIPDLPAITSAGLRARLAPLRDARVLTTLASTTLCLSASWAIYSYVDRALAAATGGDAGNVATALLVFGTGAVTGNMLTGRLTDRYGPRTTISITAPVLVAVATLVPLAASSMAAALVLCSAWGLMHWTVNVPQQLRVTANAQHPAPVVLGLHQSSIYVGIGVGGAVGAIGLDLGGRPGLGLAAFALGLLALGVLALSFRLEARASMRSQKQCAGSGRSRRRLRAAAATASARATGRG